MVVGPKGEYKTHEATKWLVDQHRWTKTKRRDCCSSDQRGWSKKKTNCVSLWGRGEWGGDLRISITYHPYKLKTKEEHKQTNVLYIAIVYKGFLIIVFNGNLKVSGGLKCFVMHNSMRKRKKREFYSLALQEV